MLYPLECKTHTRLSKVIDWSWKYVLMVTHLGGRECEKNKDSLGVTVKSRIIYLRFLWNKEGENKGENGWNREKRSYGK